MRNVIAIQFRMAAILVTAPLSGQRGPDAKASPPAPPPAATVASSAANALSGKQFDFQDAQVRVVIQALAEAGGVGLAMSSPPYAAMTLHMPGTTSKADIIAEIKSIADANGMEWSEPTPGNLTLVGPPPALSPQLQQAALQQQQQAVLDSLNKQSIHVYQLKHNSAATLAPVLTTLFEAQNGGRGGGGGGGTTTGTGGGTQGGNTGRTGGDGGGGGRGGGGGG